MKETYQTSILVDIFRPQNKKSVLVTDVEKMDLSCTFLYIEQHLLST